MTASPQPKAFEIDNDLARDAREAVHSAFKDFFGLQLQNLKEQRTSVYISQGDISGVVGMIQVEMEGNLILCFPEKTIYYLMEKIYRQPIEEMNCIVHDGVGELTNTIYCRIKKNLNERGHGFQMAIPNVIVGQNHRVYQIQKCESLVQVFGFDDYQFEIVITLKNSKSKSSKAA